MDDAVGRIDAGRLTREAQSMYECLSSARWMLSFWLDVGREDPAAPNCEAVARRVLAKLESVQTPIQRRTGVQYRPPIEEESALRFTPHGHEELVGPGAA
jgi:hypothetical protein